MKFNKTSIKIAIFFVVGFTSLSLHAATRSTPVSVINDTSSPIPVTVEYTSEYQFVGVSSETIDGLAGGMSGMHNLCKSDYGLSAKMCSSAEMASSLYSSSPGLPQLDSGRSDWWVDPIIENVVIAGDYVNYYLQGGRVANEYLGSSGLLNGIACRGFNSNSNSIYGLVYHRNADVNYEMFMPYQCHQPIPVACCIPQ